MSSSNSAPQKLPPRTHQPQAPSQLAHNSLPDLPEDLLLDHVLDEDVSDDPEDHFEDNASQPKRNPRTTKNRREKPLDVIQARIQALTDALKQHGVFIGEPDAGSIAAPVDEDVDHDPPRDGAGVPGKESGKLDARQRKGGGTGNTKEHKKRLKNQHRQLLERWLAHLEAVSRERGIEV